MWFDKDMLDENHIYEVKKLCTGGFDIMPFRSWEEGQLYIKKCGMDIYK